MDIEIAINPFFRDALSCCEPDINLITLGYEFRTANKLLSDNDFNIYIADVITHEIIHAILYRDFNGTICKLFDAIEHFFTTDMNIKEKIMGELRGNETFPMTWHADILKNGFENFLNTYHIDKMQLNQAFIIAGGIYK